MLMDSEPRPCHMKGQFPNACAAAHYRRITDNHVNLHGAWEGWRLAGRDLVAPDRQRISPERLKGLLFRQASEERIAKARARRNSETLAKLMPLPARELFCGQA